MDSLLTEAAESLDIPPSRLQDAIDKYEAVGRFLSEDPSSLAKYDPDVHPHGSLATGTCVKPIGRDEFDLDTVCLMAIPATLSQAEAKRIVGSRFKEDKTYEDMLEEKKRCWCLNYANQFHMDVLPAKPDYAVHGSILVPDKKLSCWMPSNPRGYAEWFLIQAQRSADGQRGARLEARASVEPISAPAARARFPLQKAVQLLKRHRDVMFQKRPDKDRAPISIIITTLAGRAYEGQESVLLTMKHLIARMPEFIEVDNLGRAWIRNPTRPDENFAEKWHSEPACQQAFNEWMVQANRDVRALEAAQGLPVIAKCAEPFLGQRRTRMVMDAYAGRMEKARSSGLYVSKSTGLLGVAPSSGAARVRRNTFFGD